MTDVILDRLYKYVGITPRVIQQLCMGEIYFADPGSFNDPLDCRPKVHADVSTAELQQIFHQLIGRRISKEVADAMKQLRFKAETILTRQSALARKVYETQMQNILNLSDHPDVDDTEEFTRLQMVDAIEYELRKAYDKGVLCLSSKFDNPLMWSHYADQHRGICLEFDVSKLLGDVRKVSYGDSRELAASTIHSWLRSDDAIAAAQIERACLLTKASDWGYEAEYRLLGRRGCQPSIAPLRSVTFGMKCEGALMYATIAALGGEKSVLEFYRIAHPGARFELRREAIEIGETMAGMPRINILEEFEVLPLE